MLKHVIVGFVSLVWSASVGAETITVCLDGSCDYTDIQSAVNAAEDGCVINVAAGTYYESQGSGLLPTINTYDKNVVIQGSVDSTGYPTTIVRHSDPYGVCIVSNGASGNGVLFRDLLVVRSSFRGAVSLSDSTASFQNCVLGRSVVFASSGETQLIRAEDSQVTCDDCLLTANHAEWGAAISIHGGSLACTATVFQFNQMNILSALEYGGALTAVDAEVSLSNCQFIGNESQVSGAAVALKNCSTVVAGCTFEANKVISSVSPYGGAVYHSQGELQLIDTTFTGNEALYTSCGGAVCSRSGVLLIERCLFESNSADQQGGAVSAGSNSVFRVSQSRFFSNQSFEGGAIHAANPAGLELVDSVVSGNDALNGGGLYLYGVNSSLQSNLICGNTSANISGLFEDAGGNQIFDECSQVTFTVCAEGCHYQDVSEAVGAAPPGSTIQLFAETYALSETINPSGKTITILGAVDPFDGTPTSILDAQGQFRVLLCNSGEGPGTVFENLVLQNGLGSLDSTPITGLEVGGGGLFVGSSPLLTNCHFKSNTSGHGGGLFLYEASAPTLDGCLFESNNASLYGGAFYIYRSSPSIQACEFVLNRASGIFGGGGAVYLNESQAQLSECVFTSNAAPGTPEVPNDGGAGGGAIYSLVSQVDLTNVTFTSNSSEYGGAIWNERGSGGVFEFCEFHANTADFYGGACANDESSAPILVSCSFLDNSSERGGAVCSFDGSRPVHNSCIFLNNQATFGGAIYFRDGVDAQFNDCLFESNYAVYGGGAYHSIYSQGAVSYSDCSFNENTAQQGGGGIRNRSDAPVLLLDCQFFSNSSGTHGGAVSQRSAGLMQITGCAFEENQSTYGGALQFLESNSVIYDCSFLRNSAVSGGAAHNQSSSPVYELCGFFANDASSSGGSITCFDQANPRFINCTLTDGVSPVGGAMWNDSSVPELNSSTICGNGAEQISGPWLDDGGNCISELCGDLDLTECFSEICQADINGDRVVDGGDLSVLLGYWGLVYNPADLNSDGEINGADLSILLSLWGDCDG